MTGAEVGRLIGRILDATTAEELTAVADNIRAQLRDDPAAATTLLLVLAQKLDRLGPGD